jgi:hypothetical protein
MRHVAYRPPFPMGSTVMSAQTPEERATSLVIVDSLSPGGPLFVQLKGETEPVIRPL